MTSEIGFSLIFHVFYIRLHDFSIFIFTQIVFCQLGVVEKQTSHFMAMTVVRAKSKKFKKCKKRKRKCKTTKSLYANNSFGNNKLSFV